MTTAQIKALRSLDPQDDYAPARKVNARTLAALSRYGFVKGDQITDSGLNWIRAYVRQTGNGPEDLKTLLRF